MLSLISFVCDITNISGCRGGNRLARSRTVDTIELAKRLVDLHRTLGTMCYHSFLLLRIF